MNDRLSAPYGRDHNWSGLRNADELVRTFRKRERDWDELSELWNEDSDLRDVVQPSDVMAGVVSFLEKLTARSRGDLILLGDIGTGKTRLCRAIAHEAVFRGITTAFVSSVDLASADIDELAKIRLLFLDDLGVEADTPTRAERLFRLVDARWNAGRPTVISSNLSLDALADRLGERVWDRIDGPVLVLTGPSRRKHRVETPDHDDVPELAPEWELSVLLETVMKHVTNDEKARARLLVALNTHGEFYAIARGAEFASYSRRDVQAAITDAVGDVTPIVDAYMAAYEQEERERVERAERAEVERVAAEQAERELFNE